MVMWQDINHKRPNDGEQCLVYEPKWGIRMLVWNEYYTCWDDEDGDDCFSKDLTKLCYWQSLPEKPDYENKTNIC